MLFMIIETFSGGNPVPVYQRFRDRGRMMPDGVEYLGSWVTADMRRCFQIMKCEDRRLLDVWMANWNDIVEFEVIPVVTSAQAAAAVAGAEGPAELWKAPGLVPSLAFQDVPHAVEWLTRAFGFRERSAARLSWAGGCRAWMELGDALINVTTEGGHGLRSPMSVGGVSVTMKIYVDDVDAHFARAKAAGASILSEPEDGFWGGRVYRASDLEGHHWEFAQRGRDLSAEAWRPPQGVKQGPL